jgi:hypothetical protein
MSNKQHNLISLIFVVNGKEVHVDKVNVEQPLKVSVEKALGENSRPPSDYDVLYNNTSLDINKSIEDNNIPDKATIYLSLKGGKGGC